MRAVGSQSMIDELKFVVLKRPQASHRDQATIDDQWQGLAYLHRTEYDRVCREFDAFLALVEGSGAEIGFLPAHSATGLDSIYTHDPLVVSKRGAILCTMGKAARAGEPDAFAVYLQAAGVPVVGRIEPPGTLEGGDVCWLDERTVAVGHGYRTNAEGIRQLTALLGGDVDEVISVPLPHWTGPVDCLHLLSFISPVDDKSAVVYSRMMPVPFRQLLLERGWQLIEVPDAEYDSFACNVLALSPGECVMVAGNPITQSRLEAAGVAVRTFPGQHLCIAGGGGPTCLTRPIVRGGIG
ncbi:MAG: amidinotransferase [Chloroflexi bacterium]|nr:MAG: amidinotransferase [Chloroflexota bacterium]